MAKKAKKSLLPKEGKSTLPAKGAGEIRQISKDWEAIWDAEFQLAFETLLPKQRQFVIEYVRNGYKKREAFANAYGTSYSANLVHNLLGKQEIQLILGRFTDWARDDLFQAHRVLEEAMDATYTVGKGKKAKELPDHMIRIKAAEAINKMSGNNKEKPPETPAAGSVTMNFVAQFNTYAQQMGVAPVPIPAAIIEKSTELKTTEDFAKSFQKFAKDGHPG